LRFFRSNYEVFMCAAKIQLLQVFGYLACGRVESSEHDLIFIVAGRAS
nr:hypothetical protein [Tanacetum cinerariifolium]